MLYILKVRKRELRKTGQKRKRKKPEMCSVWPKPKASSPCTVSRLMVASSRLQWAWKFPLLQSCYLWQTKSLLGFLHSVPAAFPSGHPMYQTSQCPGITSQLGSYLHSIMPLLGHCCWKSNTLTLSSLLEPQIKFFWSWNLELIAALFLLKSCKSRPSMSTLLSIFWSSL